VWLVADFGLATYWSLLGVLPQCLNRRRQAVFASRLAPQPPWLGRFTYILCGVCLTNAIFLDLMFWAFLANGFGGFVNVSVHLINGACTAVFLFFSNKLRIH